MDEMRNGGKHYQNLSTISNFSLLAYYVEKEDFKRAYEIAGERENNQMPRELTLYLLKEHGVSQTDPLHNLDFVPNNYLYEACEKDLFIYIPENIESIGDNAFRYCSLKKLLIHKNIKKIGKSALCLNSGTLEYEGTKEEFVSKFLGKSECFVGASALCLKCSDGDMVIE